MFVVAVLSGTEAVSGAAVILAVIDAVLIAILAGGIRTSAIAIIAIVAVSPVVSIIPIAVAPAPVTIPVAVTVTILISIAVSVTVPVAITVLILVLVAPTLIHRNSALHLCPCKSGTADGQSGGNKQHSQLFHKITPLNRPRPLDLCFATGQAFMPLVDKNPRRFTLFLISRL